MAVRTRSTRTLAVMAAGVLLGATLVQQAPAQAFSQYCGKDQEGIHKEGYAAGSYDNGHPDHEADPQGWAGGAAVGTAKNVALALNRVSAFIAMSEKIYDVLDYAEPIKEVKLGFSVAALAADIATTAADAVVMGLEQQNAEINACGAVFVGDTVDLLFVTEMQEDLGAVDPSGESTVPSSMFMLPDDGNPDWNRDATRYRDRNGHADLALPYAAGFANDPYVGVATMVRNTIAHLEAHGINTGGGTVWVPGVGLQQLEGAKDLWWDGMRLLQDGRLQLAYAAFAEAYRVAVSVHTNS